MLYGNKKPASNGRFGAMAAVPRSKCSGSRHCAKPLGRCVQPCALPNVCTTVENNFTKPLLFEKFYTLLS